MARNDIIEHLQDLENYHRYTEKGDAIEAAIEDLLSKDKDARTIRREALKEVQAIVFEYAKEQQKLCDDEATKKAEAKRAGVRGFAAYAIIARIDDVIEALSDESSPSKKQEP